MEFILKTLFKFQSAVKMQLKLREWHFISLVKSNNYHSKNIYALKSNQPL